MMKIVLLAVAFICLVQPSFQLKCYECRSEKFVSRHASFNSPELQICGDDMKNWPTRTTAEVSYERCKKILETVEENGKSKQLVIRTIGAEDMKLDKKFFEEYSCNGDLCNSAVGMYATTFAVVFSIIATLTVSL